MRLSPDTLHKIEGFVRGGFEKRDRIIEIICQEMYAPGELDEAEVTAAVDAAFASLASDQTTWPATTDCDRLDGVFAALNTRGIIALQNAGLTMSDGYTSSSIATADPICIFAPLLAMTRRGTAPGHRPSSEW